MEDTPSGRPFSEAFDIGRSLTHGWRSLVRCFPILFVGGCFKACTDGGGGGGGNSFGGGGNDEETERMLRNLFNNNWSPSDLRAGLGRALEPMVQATPEDLLREVGLEGVGIAVGIAIVLAVVFALVMLILAFRAWFVPGYIRVHREILETGAGQWVTLFSGADRFVSMFLWQLLGGAVGLGSFVVLSIPAAVPLVYGIMNDNTMLALVGGAIGLVFTLPAAIYIALGMSLGDHAVVLDELGAVDALARSWSLVSGNRLWMFFYNFVTMLVQILVALPGLCLCCVGIYLTRPLGFAIRDLGVTESYLLHTQPPEVTERWSIWSWGN